MKIVKIESIKKKKYSGKIYNLAIANDESYIANGIVVHNCRSVLVPITEYDDYELTRAKPALVPMGNPGDKFWTVE